MAPAMHVVLEKPGSYSGRWVTYFRVFDPVRADEVAVQLRVFEDLDTRQELVLDTRQEPVLGSGRVEQNGDDERFVFPAWRPKR
jgi:hypothetical protein